MTDTINMTRYSTVEIDFVADDPGPSLLHCHHQEASMGAVLHDGKGAVPDGV
jgi:FtsP/CotA-like multicopper oxidase with cupredoxin domain